MPKSESKIERLLIIALEPSLFAIPIFAFLINIIFAKKSHYLESQVKFKNKSSLNTSKSLKKFYIESYGCQMNFSDSEVVSSIISKEGYIPTTTLIEADLILLNTCSIREKAETTVRKRLKDLNRLKTNEGL